MSMQEVYGMYVSCWTILRSLLQWATWIWILFLYHRVLYLLYNECSQPWLIFVYSTLIFFCSPTCMGFSATVEIISFIALLKIDKWPLHQEISPAVTRQLFFVLQRSQSYWILLKNHCKSGSTLAKISIHTLMIAIPSPNLYWHPCFCVDDISERTCLSVLCILMLHHRSILLSWTRWADV